MKMKQIDAGIYSFIPFKKMLVLITLFGIILLIGGLFLNRFDWFPIMIGTILTIIIILSGLVIISQYNMIKGRKKKMELEKKIIKESHEERTELQSNNKMPSITSEEEYIDIDLSSNKGIIGAANGLDFPILTKLVESKKCNICLGAIKTGLLLVICTCGKRFHTSCAKRVGECPSCDTSLINPKSLIEKENDEINLDEFKDLKNQEYNDELGDLNISNGVGSFENQGEIGELIEIDEIYAKKIEDSEDTLSNNMGALEYEINDSYTKL